MARNKSTLWLVGIAALAAATLLVFRQPPEPAAGLGARPNGVPYDAGL